VKADAAAKEEAIRSANEAEKAEKAE